MRYKKGGIKAWLVFATVIVIALGALLYIRSVYIKKPPVQEVTQEVKKPSKPFAKEEMSPEQKAILDSSALTDAMLSGDLAACEQIKYDEDLKNKCLDNINYAQILNSGDEKQCEKLYDEALRQQCYDKIYFAAAMDAFDSDLCGKIKDDTLKENCVNQIKALMGRTAQSASDCDSITDSFLKQQCTDNYYLTSSLKNLDTQSCVSIKDPQLKERCENSIQQNIQTAETAKAISATQKPKTVKEVLASCETQKCKDDANYNLAFQEKNLSYCSKIVDTAYQQQCIENQTDYLDQYYLRIATIKKDATYCNKISNAELKTLCTNNI
jgi:hypothetical protein